MGCGGSKDGTDPNANTPADKGGKGGKGNNTAKGKGGAKGTKGQQGQQGQGQGQQTQNTGPVTEKGYKKRIRDRMKAATKGVDIDELETSIDLFERNKMEDNGDLSNAHERMKYLRLRKQIRDAILRRHKGTLDKAIDDVESSEYSAELQNYLTEAKELQQHLGELDQYNHDILEMEQSTISEVRSYIHPPQGVHESVKGMYMVLGYEEKKLKHWNDIQMMMGRYGRDGLLREVRACDTENLDPKVCGRVQEILDEYSRDQIRTVSVGAATFHKWADDMTAKAERDRQEDQQKQQQTQQTPQNRKKTKG